MVWSLAPKKSTTVEFTGKLLWIPLQALELHGISLSNPFLRTFIKIYYFPMFHCHIVNSLKTSPIFNYFQWNCITTLFILQMQRSLFGIFSKACLTILQLLPSSRKVTFVTYPVLKLMHGLLFLTIENWGDQLIVHSILKGTDDG